MIALLVSTVTLLYISFIGLLLYGFNKVIDIDSTSLKPKFKSACTKFTIIVPFRNEAQNLPVLLDSLSKLNYPIDLFEVILIDDDSDDQYKITEKNYRIKIIKNIRVSHSPKKDAITTAMEYVNSDWVITTDADCVVPINWLSAFDHYIQKEDVTMIAAAVTYNCTNFFIHHFQQLELASLQGATIGGFGINKAFMCNGANFAYTKTLFKTLDGFNGNNNIASGDDVFLLQKAVARFSEQVHYLKSKEAIVTTKPLNNWKSLFYQRVRWASKTSSYQSVFGKTTGLIVFLGNLSVIASLTLLIIDYLSWNYFFILILLKFTVDSLLIYRSNNFLTKTKIQHLILSSLLYPFFSVTVAIYSIFGKYGWKDRRF
ncbi:cellulose synthase/poly-beta-1,6-N-acetylglucosamine synthase-like glycosyltransferase [Flavobacterium sp. PL11]|jgi:cellulose synthase/poly-beta-1,6-N-acetylglucosamine synthase-like glycosyltransferase|uniref:glycosyltransferase family 2 protein n=1 Tax=Flavobacterium sp. PL11 TaxID=3071717 RepID=UPI002E0CAFA1|nr:cellulose synthase/poly-beta-1,6-N-acetylglucosamine synthase-like glycosyltransferase [Flavobacterium sp. PL11]